MKTPFKNSLTWILDSTLGPHSSKCYGVLWDDIVLCPITNFSPYSGTEDFVFHYNEDIMEYIILVNKAGINGECLSWDQIKELYGANDLEYP